MKKCNYIAILIFVSLIASCISSCTTIDPKYAKDDTSTKPTFKENLDSLISKLTYDQALMTWGQPASVFDGDEIFLATWGNANSGSAIFPIYNTWFSLPIESGWKLQLSFSKTTRKLLSWKYDKW